MFQLERTAGSQTRGWENTLHEENWTMVKKAEGKEQGAEWQDMRSGEAGALATAGVGSLMLP